MATVGAEMSLRWVSTARLAADSIRLAGVLPHNATAVVGVPRSGMIPAAIIATHLHLPLYELTYNGPRRLMHGSRWKKGEDEADLERAVVVDDTVYSGSAMTRARGLTHGRKCFYAAVYVRPQFRQAVDFYAVDLPSPHLLEWNCFNNGPFRGHAVNRIYGAGVAADFDGVICHDDESGGVVGSAYMVPRFMPCRLIVTGRKERDRQVTEGWLKAHGARWDRLVMMPDGSGHGWEEIAEFKAGHYSASGCGFFVESDPRQAEKIYQVSGKPSVCPRTSQVWPEKLIMVSKPRVPITTAQPETKCVCSGPGYCQQFEREMSPVEYSLCACTCDNDRFCTPPLCDRRRKNWLAQKDGGRLGVSVLIPSPGEAKVGPAEPPPRSLGAVGTEMKMLLKELGLSTKSGCGCDSRALEMDRWGIDGCEEKRQEILTWLRDEQIKRKWTDKAKVAAMYAYLTVQGKGFKLDPWDPAPGLLDESIRRARAKLEGVPNVVAG